VTSQLKRLLLKFKEEGIDSLLITKDINAAYITNFDSHESWILITPKKRIYITDFRYAQEARVGIKKFSIHRIDGSVFEAVATLANRLKLKKLFFEGKNISFAEFRKIKTFLSKKKIKFLPTYDFIESIRAIKTEGELSKIKTAIERTIEAFRFIQSTLKPGIKESQLAIELEYFIRKKGVKFAFEPLIASGINSAYPHAKITNKTILNNEAVTVDMGLDFEGYKSDLTRVFFLGRIPLSLKRIYSIVLKAQREAIKKIKAGVRASEIDKVARNFIISNQLGKYFGHALGHGIGREVHEDPSISSKCDAVLKEGMVFTVEPAVYIPKKFGIRVEDVVLVKKEGCEVLSASLNKSN